MIEKVDEFAPRLNAGERQSSIASFFAWIFIVVTGLVILGLFTFRMIWIAQVLGLFGQRFDGEVTTDYSVGPLYITTGDPSVFFFCVVCIFFAVLLLFGRERLDGSIVRLERALKGLVLYSILMIAVQLVVLLMAVIRSGNSKGDLLTSTYVFVGGSPEEGGRRILQVTDPHFVTLILGLLGLLLLSDPELAKRVWKYLTSSTPRI